MINGKLGERVDLALSVLDMPTATSAVPAPFVIYIFILTINNYKLILCLV